MHSPHWTRPFSYGITVLGDANESWRPGSTIWNQHAFHLTNIEPDGTVPTTPAPNWDSFNSFRSGGLTLAPEHLLPDLLVQLEDVCGIDCGDGELQAWVRVGNQGFVDVEGATLSLWADSASGPTLLVSEPLDVLTSGRLEEGVLLEVTGADLSGVDAVWVEVTGPDLEGYQDCLTTNNEVRWEGPICD